MLDSGNRRRLTSSRLALAVHFAFAMIAFATPSDATATLAVPAGAQLNVPRPAAASNDANRY